jgi:hypothetical protein
MPPWAARPKAPRYIRWPSAGHWSPSVRQMACTRPMLKLIATEPRCHEAVQSPVRVHALSMPERWAPIGNPRTHQRCT